jgi:hypothetical protein
VAGSYLLILLFDFAVAAPFLILGCTVVDFLIRIYLLTIILLGLCVLPIYFRSFFYKNLFQKLAAGRN